MGQFEGDQTMISVFFATYAAVFIAEIVGDKKDQRYTKGALVAFAAIFFSEWGDVGQITAAAMAARFGAPFLVWAGAVAAMATKGAWAASMPACANGLPPGYSLKLFTG